MPKTITRQRLVTNPQKPHCPRHEREMQFDKVRSQWVCPVRLCKIVATLKADTSPIKPAASLMTHIGDALAIGEIDGEPIYHITAVDESGQEFVVDVTSQVEMIIDGNKDVVSLVLTFTAINRFVGHT